MTVSGVEDKVPGFDGRRHAGAHHRGGRGAFDGARLQRDLVPGHLGPHRHPQGERALPLPHQGRSGRRGDPALCRPGGRDACAGGDARRRHVRGGARAIPRRVRGVGHAVAEGVPGRHARRRVRDPARGNAGRGAAVLHRPARMAGRGAGARDARRARSRSRAISERRHGAGDGGDAGRRADHRPRAARSGRAGCRHRDGAPHGAAFLKLAYRFAT